MSEYIFILSDQRVDTTPLIDEVGICVDSQGRTHQPGEFTRISADERLVLTPAKDLSDEELKEALQALQRTRLEQSDRLKGRTRVQNYEAQTGLRLSKEQLEAKTDDAFDKMFGDELEDNSTEESA